MARKNNQGQEGAELAGVNIEADTAPIVIAEQERFRAVDLARELGYLPEMTSTMSRANPVTVNQRAWLYRAAKLRFKFDGETQMGRQEFIEKIKAVEAL